jgi:3-methyladenine DNA glycosylase/8-oxoguanine DNA glycosylase
MSPPTQQRRYRPVHQLDLHATLGPHIRGPGDPCHRVEAAGAHWRTWETPDGPVTLRLAAAGGEVHAQAWGPGSAWAIDGVPALLGADDDWSGLALAHRVLRDAHRRSAGLRLSSNRRVFETLVAAVIEQLVTRVEAQACWSRLVSRFGTPAPGPNPLRLKVFPGARRLSEIPDWDWHGVGLDGRRRRTVIAAAKVAARIDECAGLDVSSAARRLSALPGVGPWTVAETLQRSHGAADLVSVGDYHIPNVVSYALTGHRRADDAGMLRLLEPYRGHRQRVVRLVLASGVLPPRHGPRLPARENRFR